MFVSNGTAVVYNNSSSRYGRRYRIIGRYYDMRTAAGNNYGHIANCRFSVEINCLFLPLFHTQL